MCHQLDSSLEVPVPSRASKATSVTPELQGRSTCGENSTRRVTDTRVRERFISSLPRCDADLGRDADRGCRPGGRGWLLPFAPSLVFASSAGSLGTRAARGLPPCLMERVHELLY